MFNVSSDAALCKARDVPFQAEASPMLLFKLEHCSRRDRIRKLPCLQLTISRQSQCVSGIDLFSEEDGEA